MGREACLAAYAAESEASVCGEMERTGVRVSVRGVVEADDINARTSV